MSRPTSSALNKLGALGGAPPTASRRPSTTSRGRTGTGSRTGTAYQMDAMKLALMDALVRKLRAKFPKDVKTQEVIGREVTAFMRADRETVSEADLTSLENKIAKLLKMGGGGEWGSVFEYEAAMHAEAETKKRTNKVETAKRMKAELDKQVRLCSPFGSTKLLGLVVASSDFGPGNAWALSGGLPADGWASRGAPGDARGALTWWGREYACGGGVWVR